MSRIFPLSFFSLLLFGSLLLSNLSRVSLGAAPPPSSVPSYSKPYVPSQAGTVNASPPVPPPPSQYSPPPPSQYPPPPPPPSYGSPPPAAQNSYSPPSVPSYSQSPPPPQQGYIPPQGGTPPYNQQQPGVGVPPGGQPPPPPSGTNQYGQAASYVPATRSSISSSSSFIETSPHVQPPPAPSAAGGDQGSSSSNGQRAKPLWQESVGSVELARHSWTAPLTYENHLGEWDLAMATVPTEHYVVLTPAVANRTGQFWHRQPLLTSNFEIQFGFGVHGDDSAYIDFISSGGRKNRVTRPAGGQQAKAGGAASGPYIGKPEGFALWYVYDEYARVYPKSKAEETQWNLFGYKNRPRGLGVFFKVFDRYGQLRPSISVAWNDENGNRALDPIRDVPLPSGIFYRYRNLNEPAVFKLAAGPTGIVGEIRLTPGGAWLTCFHLKDVRLKPGGYLGFTAYNGPEPHLLQTAASPPPPTPGSTPGGGIADLVVLYFVKVWNLDLSVRGEGDEILDKEMADVPVDDLLKSHSVHKSQKELSDSLKQLTRMLYKHIAEQSPREQTMQRTINSLNTQVSRMATEIKDMKREILMQIQRSSGSATGKGSTEGSSGSISDQALHTVRSELHGLKSLLAKHSQLHKDSLQTLHQKVEAARAAAPSIAMTPELREFANRARDLEQTIAKKEHFSYLMTIVLIIVLLIFALFVWKRFRDMEKKHLL